VTVTRLLRIARQRTRSLARASALDRELESELAFHFDALVQERLAAGLALDEARQEARRALGNLAVVKDQCRDHRRVAWLDDLRADLAFGVRMLRKSPLFTAVAVLSLELGIGANAAVLAVVDAVWRVGLQLPDADRLLSIRSLPRDESEPRGVSVHEYLAWKHGSRALESIELSIAGPRDLGTELDGRPPARITGQSVTPGYFRTLGVQPLAGRWFAPEDRSARVTIISHRLWQSRYGGDVRTVGSTIRLNRQPTTVIGIMPADFQYGDPRVDCWTPFDIEIGRPYGPGRLFGVIARLAPGTTIEQARAELASASARLALERADRNDDRGALVLPLHEALFGWTRQPFVTVQLAAALVLLIACGNVAGLLLARTSGRRRELALRVAIGAGRGRLVRQLLTESLLVAAVGAVAGLVVAWWATRFLTLMAPPLGMPGIAPPAPTLVLPMAVALLATLAGALSGIVPALLAGRFQPSQLARPVDSGATPRVFRIGRSGLVAGQLALAFVLLVAFGLLAHSFVRLAGRELNFDRAGLLTFEVRVHVPPREVGPGGGMPGFEIAPQMAARLQRIDERLASIPGVVSVGGSAFPPVDSLVLPVMDVIVDATRAGATTYFLVTPGFFHTMRSPIVRGRDFTATDTAGSPWVAIVNETAARMFWPGRDPIGRQLRLDVVPDELPREVVGVVRDIPLRYGETTGRPVVYASYLQQPSRYRAPWNSMFGQMTFLMRYTGDPVDLAAEARRAVAELEPDRALASLMTLDERLAFGTRRLRSTVVLFGTLAACAVLLAAMGVYALVAYSVGQMTHEIGVRKALGAGSRDILATIGRHGLVVIVAGLVPGCAGALLFSRAIASQLWGVAPWDPPTFGAAALLFVSAALLSCIGPARRALRVDPAAVLRLE
jgi:predicted permease